MEIPWLSASWNNLSSLPRFRISPNCLRISMGGCAEILMNTAFVLTSHVGPANGLVGHGSSRQACSLAPEFDIHEHDIGEWAIINATSTATTKRVEVQAYYIAIVSNMESAIH